MKTQFLKANDESIALACNLLQKGEVIAIPTETVYGLAGDCKNKNAIKKIFEAKGRPADNPLIVHISNMDMLDGIVDKIPTDAQKLADTFWPGPLTIIMPKGPLVSTESCAGLDSVGVRMPAHPIAHEIIEKSKIPFSAPSANLSGKPSPTTANDVLEDMNGRIPLIIDDGESSAGVESTVISVLGETPVILRPGVITKEMIENVLQKPVVVSKSVIEGISNNDVVESPGMKYKHYSPNANITIIKGTFSLFQEFVQSKQEDGVFALCFDGEEEKLKIPCVTFGQIDNPLSQAQKLFSALRKLDKKHAKIVYARCPETSGVGLAVYNRLIRAAGFQIINLQNK